MATAAQTTKTANDTTPAKTGLRGKARATAGSAKKKPVAATAIAAGATAAIVGATFGVIKLVRKSGSKPKASAPRVEPAAS